MHTAQRTHTCGELTGKDIDKEVVLNGWVGSRRDHGGVIFIDLRDRYGLTQVVFNPDAPFFSEAEKLRREDVISISGNVRHRPEGMKNSNLHTGEIEILSRSLHVLNKAEVPPMEIDDRIEPGEEIRLKYRYLDLRRPKVLNGIVTKHKLLKSVRDFYHNDGFLEIETPILSKSTPEGARDYLVPSRVHQGKFYALPQSPQLFKQILMIAGMDKYFQIARCFRDEDLRADRQPEFTQIDVEISFADVDTVIASTERMIAKLWKDVLGIQVNTPFKRMNYVEAIERYGSDKPDLRYEMELKNVSSIVKNSGFTVFSSVASEGAVMMMNAHSCGSMSRTEIEELIAYAQSEGAKGMAWIKVKGAELDSSIVKFFKPEEIKQLAQAGNAKDNDMLLFVADKNKTKACNILGKVRVKIAEIKNLTKDLGKKDTKDAYEFLWVVEFPLFEWSEQEQRHVSVHHPFTSPLDEDIPLLDTDVASIKSKAYDLVLNGQEIGGGSIRIHNPEIQKRIFRMLGITEEQAETKFGFLLEAFKYGAPPHGGIALGVDRLACILAKTDAIRDVIAFPKTKNAESLMDSCPSEVSEAQLKELHIMLSPEARAKLQKEKEEKI